MSDETYNGWSSYATWGVALVLDNDEPTYRAVHARAQEAIEAAPDHRNVPEMWTARDAARFELADWLHEYVDELCDRETVSGALMARQVIMAGLAEVDWQEIADHYIEDDA